jgi:hypothetical protein
MARNVRVNITDFGDVVNVEIVTQILRTLRQAQGPRGLFSDTEVGKNGAQNVVWGNYAGYFA